MRFLSDSLRASMLFIGRAALTLDHHFHFSFRLDIVLQLCSSSKKIGLSVSSSASIQILLNHFMSGFLYFNCLEDQQVRVIDRFSLTLFLPRKVRQEIILLEAIM